VAAVHDLHVWTVTTGMVAMSGHAIVPDLGAHPGVLEEIRTEMCRLGIGHVTIQLELAEGCEDLVQLEAAGPPADGSRHGHPH
jgi:cobalt-zinc-cadmium efflux system protein